MARQGLSIGLGLGNSRIYMERKGMVRKGKARKGHTWKGNTCQGKARNDK